MLDLLHPLPKRIPACECGATATHYAESFFAGGFFCDECAVAKAAESWAGVNATLETAGYEMTRTDKGYEAVRKSR